MRGPRRSIRITRDLVLFTFGLAGIAYETLAVHVDRPSLLILFGGCIGLPAFLRADEKAPPPPAPPPSVEPPPTPHPRKRAAAKKAAPVKKATKRGTSSR